MWAGLNRARFPKRRKRLAGVRRLRLFAREIFVFERINNQRQLQQLNVRVDVPIRAKCSEVDAN